MQSLLAEDENDKQTGAEIDEKQNSVIQTGNFPGYSLMREC